MDVAWSAPQGAHYHARDVLASAFRYSDLSLHHLGSRPTVVISRWTTHPCHCSLFFYRRWRRPVTSLIANLWICSERLIFATRFGNQACILYSRCGGTSAPYNWMKVIVKRLLKERLILKISRPALLSLSIGAFSGRREVHWSEGQSALGRDRYLNGGWLLWNAMISLTSY